VATVTLVIAGLPALTKLQFDFNPLHLRNSRSEAIATLLQLGSNPAFATDSAQVFVRSNEEAAAVAKKLSRLPEVAQTRTIDGLVPADQDHKLPLIQDAARTLAPALHATARPTPSDAEDVAALRSGAQRLAEAAADQHGDGAQAARRLAADLTRIADASSVQRASAAQAFLDPLKTDLGDLRDALQAQPVSRASLPDYLVRDWVAPDGRERVAVLPKGDTTDNTVLKTFANAVLQAEPAATGQAIETLQWERTITRAFMEAAAWAGIAIAILLWIALRRVWDVLLTLVPLVVAALVTLEICALTGFALNYANIIALPVLLGVGVAFKIYYIVAWRGGETHFLQSMLTRAVFFSALLTATAFGSLWLSTHPGISSMGKLLALSLACTLASAVLFQPALMGDPRRSGSA
jgi:hopanoid biosynthesis associated RND transporter like protein HpnN